MIYALDDLLIKSLQGRTIIDVHFDWPEEILTLWFDDRTGLELKVKARNDVLMVLRQAS